MTPRRQSSEPPKSLRPQAEKWPARTAGDLARMPVDELRELVQELQVRQGELERQNEELRRTPVGLEAARERLLPPYDAALQAQEEQFRQLAESIADVFWIASPDLQQILFVSPSYERIWGHPTESLYANPHQWIEAAVLEDRDRVAAVFASLAEREPAVSIEYRIVRPDGSIRWVQDRGFQVRDATGSLIRLTGVAQDITERKRAEAQTRAFAQLSQRLSVSTDPHGAAAEVASTALELFHWDACFLLLYDAVTDTVRDLINQDTINGERVAVPIAKDVRNPTPMLRRVLEQGGQLLLRRDETDQAGLTLRFGDMHRVSLSLMFVPLRHQGQVTGFLSVQSYRRNAYAAHDMVVLQALADQCAGAIVRIGAEAALRAALTDATRLRAAMDEVQACVYMKDTQSRYFYANRPTLQLFGCSAEAMAGRDDTQFFPPDTARKIREADARVLRGDQVVQENDVPDARGGRRVYWDIKTPIYADAEHQTVSGLLGISTDITERKQAESALRESEQRYRHLFELESDALFLVDSQTHCFLDANQSAQQLYGYSREEFLQMKAEAVSTTPEETRINVASGHYRVPLRWHRKKDGTVFPVEITANLIVHQERRVELAAIRDITERQQAMNRLEETTALLLDAQKIASLGSYVFEVATGRWTCSQVLDELFGIAEAGFTKDVTGWLELVHPEERADLRRYLNDQVLKSREAFDRIYRIVRLNDRQERWVHGIGKLVLDDQGRVAKMAGVIQDITASKRAEMAVKKSEEKFTKLFRSTPAIVCVSRLDDGRMLDINLEFERKLEYSRNEIIGRTSAEIGLWGDFNDRHTIVQAIQKTGQLRDFELNLRSKSGVLSSYRLFGDAIEMDNAPCLLAAFIDITAQKQAEAALRESEEKYRSLFTFAPIGIFQSTSDRVRFINPAMATMFGYASPAEMLADHPNPASLFVHPEQRSQMIREALASGTYVTHQVQERRKDGSIFTTSTQLRVICDAAGSLKFVEGFVQDITERVRIEESHARLATAIEQAAETVVITDAHGVILYANPAFEKSSGYTRAEALGRNPRVLKSGKHDADFYRQLWATLQRGEVWSGHFVNRGKDGTLYEEDATISPIRDADGALINYVAVKRDVTHEVLLEAQVRQSQKMEAIGTLAGGIAHDFNNMLGALFGYAYLLQEDTKGNALAQESVEEILKAANRAKELVQQILTFSRRRESNRQVIRLDSTIKEAMKFLRASLPANLKIELQIAPDAPAVLADATQIYQVTMNLATNALHAMEGRTGTLTVALEPFLPDEAFLQTHPQLHPIHYARLTIADTGHGMDAKTLERIYEPFFTTKPVGKGTGLGLSVVHGILKSHDGVITVKSHVGQGTTFRLYFPAKSQTEAIADVDGTIGHGRGRGQSILVLDDEIALTAVIQKMLCRLNYQVATSNHAGEAIRLVRQNPSQFDLVITDLTMPETNGLEVARQLHAIRPELLVMLVTGNGDALDADSLAEAGICNLLQKPVSLAALACAVQGALGNPHIGPRP